MPEPGGGGKGDLQFDRAEFGIGAPASLTCAQCSLPIGSAYFEAAGKVVCEPCRYKLEEFLNSKAGLSGVLKALAAGIGAGIVGWVIYYAVLALSGYEFGLIAVVVGVLVGRAVRWGSGNRGGALFQAMAIALTYVTIVTTYVPLIVKSIREDHAKQAAQGQQAPPAGAAQTAPGKPSVGGASSAAAASAAERPTVTPGQFFKAIGLLGLLILAIPFLQGVENVIGIAIIGFALYEAWRVNRRVKIDITGPFAAGNAPAA